MARECGLDRSVSTSSWRARPRHAATMSSTPVRTAMTRARRGRRLRSELSRRAGANVCGNGVHEIGEQCDDGNGDPGDGCDATCRFRCSCAATAWSKSARNATTATSSASTAVTRHADRILSSRAATAPSTPARSATTATTIQGTDVTSSVDWSRGGLAADAGYGVPRRARAPRVAQDQAQCAHCKVGWTGSGVASTPPARGLR